MIRVHHLATRNLFVLIIHPLANSTISSFPVVWIIVDRIAKLVAFMCALQLCRIQRNVAVTPK